jgi:hypothetical protein
MMRSAAKYLRHGSSSESSQLWGAADLEHGRVLARKLTPTKWANKDMLIRLGIRSDFKWMAKNAEMSFFTSLRMDTYRNLTIQFLSTFIDTHQENYTVSFMMHDELHTLGYNEFCDYFWFSHDS